MSSDMELKAIEARLSELENEWEILLARRSALLDTNLAVLRLSSSQKIDIYMKLFRGRQDIYLIAGRTSKDVAGIQLVAIMSGNKVNAINLRLSARNV